MDTPTTTDSMRAMRDYYAQRAAYYERVYHKPERQSDLRAMEAAMAAPFQGRRVLEVACGTGCWWSHVPLQRLPAWLELLHRHLAPGARVVMLDNSFVQTSSTPLTRRDADGNTYQNRTLDDGSVHEVLKNFPTRDEAFTMLGPRARDAQWLAHTHYWVLTSELS